MPPRDPKTYLWENVEALLKEQGLSLDAVQRRLKIGRGSVQRLQEGGTSIGVNILRQVAEVFGLEVWQLLVPDLDPNDLPELRGSEPARWPFSQQLLAAVNAEPDKAWQAENGARAALNLDPLPRPANEIAA